MGVKVYFNQQTTQDYAQQKLRYEKYKAEQVALLEKQRLAPEAFNMIACYDKKEEKTPLFQAYQDQEFLFTIKTSKDSYPKHIITQNDIQWTRLFEQNAADSLVLYGKSEQKTLTPIANELIEDAQIFTLSLGKDSDSSQSHTAKLKNLRLQFSDSPITENALAFIQYEGKLKPVGLYLAFEKFMLPLEKIPNFSQWISQANLGKATPQNISEELYVLETPYQQLVFSNIGAALVELNLSIESPQFPKSFVKKIEVDRELEKYHPELLNFPLKPYHIPSSSPKGPFQKVQQLHQGATYYPLLRRQLPGHKAIDPENYSLNILSKYPEVASTPYQVTYFDNKKIVFESTQAHRKITKTFSVSEKDAPYCFELEIKLEGETRGLWLSSGVPEAEIISGAPQPAMKYKTFSSREKQVQNLNLPSQGEIFSQDNLGLDWVLTSNGFFGILVDPISKDYHKLQAQALSGDSLPSRLTKYQSRFDKYKADQFPAYKIMLPLAENGKAQKFVIYSGPFVEKALSQAEKAYSDSQGHSPDYLASQSFHGWFQVISEPIVKLFIFFMRLFYQLTHSWVAAILLLTLVLRAILYPLNSWTMKSMRRMSLIAPKVSEIQKKHKKNPQKAQMEIMQLYKKHKVNPFSGCLPFLFQMPFLIGMFDLLKTSFELRGASFIPGWIDNLAGPDVLFSWNFSLPIFGSELHLLPILSGLILYVQQKISQAKMSSNAPESEQQQQQKLMMNFMTIFMIVMFYNMPSGLSLYFLFSTLLGIAQQRLINQQLPENKLV